MKERDWRPFIYGGFASIVAEFGTFPIDTTKTRLQIQGQKIDQTFTKLKYTGMIDALVKINKEEGLKALYSGIWPAVLRQATYGTIKFGTYYTIKRISTEHGFFVEPKSGQISVYGNIIFAALAGALSSAIANPTDVLKVRMQVHGKSTNNLGLIGSFAEIYKFEGVRGLWRGVGPTSQRAAIIAAVELPIYDFCKHQLLNIFGDRMANHFISSFIASLGSAISSTPLDVVRTRLMNQRRIASNRVLTTTGTIPVTNLYKGSLDCAIQTVQNEGFRALYKGFIPTWFRMAPWNIIFFITYEQLKQFY